ncbi:cytochrome P450, partial [Trifolium medium]|nr:cytochrome P450 [Trifolium medium]
VSTPSLHEINESFKVQVADTDFDVRIVEEVAKGFAKDACLVECAEDNQSQYSLPSEMQDDEPLVNAYVEQLHEDLATKINEESNHRSTRPKHKASSQAKCLGPYRVRSTSGGGTQGAKNSATSSGHSSVRGRQVKKKIVVPSIRGIKKIARLSEVERNDLIRALKRDKQQRTAKLAKEDKSKSQAKQGTSLTTGSGSNSNSHNKPNNSKEYRSWLVLHGDSRCVQEDLEELGETVGLKCSNRFDVLAKGRGSGGLGAGEKRREIRRLISESKVDILCLQESKLEVVDIGLIRFLWGSEEVDFSFISSVGASGGIITIWNPRVVHVWYSMAKASCLIISGQFISNNVNFFLANVYAPCNDADRVLLWNDLSAFLQQHLQSAGCVVGDFNA